MLRTESGPALSHAAPRPGRRLHRPLCRGRLQWLSLQPFPLRDAFFSLLRNSALSQNLPTSALPSPRPEPPSVPAGVTTGDLLPNPLLLPFSPIQVVLSRAAQSPCTNMSGPRSPQNPVVASLSLRCPQASRGLHGAAQASHPPSQPPWGAAVGHHCHVTWLRSKGQPVLPPSDRCSRLQWPGLARWPLA